MIEDFNPEIRKILWDYQFIRDYINGKYPKGRKGDRLFLDNLNHAFKSELRSRHVSEQDILWLEELPKIREKNSARERKVNLIISAIRERINNEFPEIFEDYEINFVRIDYHEQIKGCESIEEYEIKRAAKQEIVQKSNFGYDAYPMFELFLQPRRNANETFVFMKLLREDVDRRTTKKNFETEHQIPSFAESIILHIDKNDFKYGGSRYEEINRCLLEHIRKLRFLRFVPEIWPWYGYLIDNHRIGGPKNKKCAHAYFFEQLISHYKDSINDPRILPLILEIYLEVFKLTQMPKTLFQQRESQIVREEFLEKVWELLGPDERSLLSSKLHN